MKLYMKKFALCVALFLPFCTWAGSDGGISPRIDQTIRTTLSDMNIKTIRSTPIVGLYELRVISSKGVDIIYYVDKTGRHLINGHMFDTRNKLNITAQRLATLNRINWGDLPLKDAIVSGPKKGAKIAVFTDPDCPYCKQLENVLGQAKGLRVYTFLFPLPSLHPDAFAKSEAIWCSKNQHQALVDVMLHGKTLKKANCSTPVKAIMALGKTFNVQGTPTLFAENGSKYAGQLSAQSIETWAKKGK